MYLFQPSVPNPTQRFQTERGSASFPSVSFRMDINGSSAKWKHNSVDDTKLTWIWVIRHVWWSETQNFLHSRVEVKISGIWALPFCSGDVIWIQGLCSSNREAEPQCQVLAHVAAPQSAVNRDNSLHFDGIKERIKTKLIRNMNPWTPAWYGLMLGIYQWTTFSF